MLVRGVREEMVDAKHHTVDVTSSAAGRRQGAGCAAGHLEGGMARGRTGDKEEERWRKDRYGKERAEEKGVRGGEWERILRSLKMSPMLRL